ncbi:hypothetical protein Baya_2374 [Bagarius yarrelli]|uniref:Uncharacterized protein n=1 Tax=Bagarius yarrelli TaxID=175774 RepID=A0A556TNR5_BAGYA|nr:hypothetical protein Baya_2374 [Bagarius yarrelli]
MPQFWHREEQAVTYLLVYFSTQFDQLLLILAGQKDSSSVRCQSLGQRTTQPCDTQQAVSCLLQSAELIGMSHYPKACGAMNFANMAFGMTDESAMDENAKGKIPLRIMQ